MNQLLRVRETAMLDAFDVISQDGRAIFLAGGGDHSISTADLPKGVYVARALINGKQEVLRFVVDH